MSTQPERTRVPVFSVGDRLRKARETAGLSQQELADAVGIARASVVNYEKAHTAPRVIVLRAWALATGVPLDWLRDGPVPRTDGYHQASRPVRHLTLVPDLAAAG